MKKYNYQIYTVQLIVPFKEAIKRNKKREKPTNPTKGYNKQTWNEKIKKKIHKGEIVIDTFKNKPEKVIEIILKILLGSISAPAIAAI